MPRILIVDDEADVADSLRLLFEAEGAEVRVEGRSAAVMEVLADWPPELVLSDLRMPGPDGLELLRRIRARHASLPVVLMSAYGSLDTGREALEQGADDYVSKPLDSATVRRLIELARRESRPVEAIEAEAVADEARFGAMIGSSAAMRNVFQMIARIAPFPSTVLLRGESGVGKEVAAREIHARSPRAARPFVAVNCAAIPDTLIESELFGYRKGAFTGADRDSDGLIVAAHGGTLFLDEIGDLPTHVQVKLLRVIQEGQVQQLGATRARDVDVRWIAATLRDLDTDVASGRFRQDLYFRINVMQVELPPLRRRGGDLRLLVAEVLHRLESRYGRGVRGIEAAAVAALQEHDFPGNVRELENLLERAYILCDGAWLTREALREFEPARSRAATADSAHALVLESLSIKQESRRLERCLITAALEQTGGNRTQAARLLEISHRALLYKIRDYGLDDVGR